YLFVEKKTTYKREQVRNLKKELKDVAQEDVKLIRDQLVRDQKQLDMVSIVGMGGLGKTTLANKVFNDPYVRYPAFWYTGQFPSSICNLWSLQTLIVRSFVTLMLPHTISNLVNLRHLRSDKNICFRFIEEPMNLLTISKVVVSNWAETLVKYIPRIKKLTSWTDADKNHFRSLTSLGTLMIL
ncbi:NB-ARC domains-containing protein, partial [Tanacetum coccineum]